MTAPKDRNSLSAIASGKNEKDVPPKAKFETYGEEMLEKEVKRSGRNGRVYLPPEWVGKRIKIIRID